MIALNNTIGLANFIVWTAGLIFICYGLSRHYPLTVVLAFGFTVFSSLRIFQNSLNGIPSNPVVREFDMAAEAALISFLFSAMIVHASSIKIWTKIFKILAVVNALAICVDSFVLSRQEPWGILFNASMSGCFGAAIFPLFEAKEKFFKYFVFISVLVAGRSLPIAVLFVGIGTGLFLEKRYRELGLATVMGFVVGFAIKGAHLFTPRGRDYIWNQAYFFFKDHLPWSVGSGLGGFYVIGPALTSKEQGVTFVWLHSDWLQILFEQGFIGFILVVAMYLHALYLSRKTPPLCSALAAYAAFGVANMPLRYPLAGLLGAFLIRWAMEKRTTEPALARFFHNLKCSLWSGW